MSKIRICQLARIPCANSGLELSNFINKYSDKYECRYILGTDYSKQCNLIPYRSFPTDLSWVKQREKCLRVIKEADIIHVHHDWDFEAVDKIIFGKKVIVTLYNLCNSLQYIPNLDFNKKYIARMKKYATIITVADQPLQKKMFSDISTIYVPLVKNLFNENTVKNNKVPHVVFAPTNREKTGIGKKMYYEVLDIIKKLEGRCDFTFDLVEGVPYLENLDRKRKADIIIDDVDPEYEKQHNTSIEAACFGAVALTNFSSKEYPFFGTDIYELETNLSALINQPSMLKKEQDLIVKWREEQYTPAKLLESYENLYEMESPKKAVTYPDLTVFIITCGDNPNYPYCLEAIQNQNCTFNIEVIRDVAPMARAFQQMIDKCKTPYYIEIDGDMVLQPKAIETMYRDIKIAPQNTAMICFDLNDTHLNVPIQGVKIYKHEVFKKYPYDQTCISCEMKQLSDMKKDKFIYEIKHIILGEHSPYWTEELIFDRYFIFMQKNQWDEIIPRVMDIYTKNPTKLNRYAVMGAISGLLIEASKKDKDFREKTPSFLKIKKYCDKINFPGESKDKDPIKPMVVDGWLDKLDEIQKLNIKFWYLKKTCLFILNQVKKDPGIISIGVRNELDKKAILNLFPEGVEVIVDSRQTIKPWNGNANVPLPVVPYLQNSFGIGWELLKE